MRSRNDHPSLIVFDTKIFGKAVFTKKFIPAGEKISEFDGPIYDNDFEDWTEDLQNHCIQIGPETWRDSKGYARYINHSCDPNCGIRGLTEIIAMRDIHAGEEITWDYEMTEKSDWWKMKCQCGSPYCRKKIGNYDHMPNFIRNRYGKFISEWLQKSK